ncbi:MAG: 50S ribosomal protein L11 methyltransferase, partial [Bacteroidales bacterium]|nr:50S ribosomal protein L11 methyltransferase [Bacteroidales bacterium]
MNYIEVKIQVLPNLDYVTDVLSSLLGDIGYESFETVEKGIIAYVQESAFDEVKLKSVFDSFPYEATFDYAIESIEDQNWNQEWEKHYFQPIVISDKCVIHSTHHTNVPKAEFDILIDPKMAFGTGHHETTFLMVSYLLEEDVRGKSLLDMGCGTAVLAILASMKGASPVLGIDIDEWAYNNALENISLNHVEEIEIKLGGAEVIDPSNKFDVVMANINRNILLNDMHAYIACMKRGSLLFM